MSETVQPHPDICYSWEGWSSHSWQEGWKLGYWSHTGGSQGDIKSGGGDDEDDSWSVVRKSSPYDHNEAAPVPWVCGDLLYGALKRLHASTSSHFISHSQYIFSLLTSTFLCLFFLSAVCADIFDVRLAMFIGHESGFQAEPLCNSPQHCYGVYTSLCNGIQTNAHIVAFTVMLWVNFHWFQTYSIVRVLVLGPCI